MKLPIKKLNEERVLNVSMRVEPGIIFCIPLFMQKDDWKLKAKLTEDDLDKEFAFGRVVDSSSALLVEIFNKISSSKTDIDDIIDSGTMFSPVSIFWDGVVKKRWRIIGKTENYDKFKDSNYASLKVAFPPGHDDIFRLLDLATDKETPISRDELMLKRYETSTVWWPIDLENRILEALKESG